jgi:hypothetical protein
MSHIVAPAMTGKTEWPESGKAHVPAVRVTRELDIETGCCRFIGNIRAMGEQQAKIVFCGATERQLQIRTTIPVIIYSGQ